MFDNVNIPSDIVDNPAFVRVCLADAYYLHHNPQEGLNYPRDPLATPAGKKELSDHVLGQAISFSRADWLELLNQDKFQNNKHAQELIKAIEGNGSYSQLGKFLKQALAERGRVTPAYKK
jgi:hypothetical protein